MTKYMEKVDGGYQLSLGKVDVFVSTEWKPWKPGENWAFTVNNRTYRAIWLGGFSIRWYR